MSTYCWLRSSKILGEFIKAVGGGRENQERGTSFWTGGGVEGGVGHGKGVI